MFYAFLLLNLCPFTFQTQLGIQRGLRKMFSSLYYEHLSLWEVIIEQRQKCLPETQCWVFSDKKKWISIGFKSIYFLIYYLPIYLSWPQTMVFTVFISKLTSSDVQGAPGTGHASPSCSVSSHPPQVSTAHCPMGSHGCGCLHLYSLLLESWLPPTY